MMKKQGAAALNIAFLIVGIAIRLSLIVVDPAATQTTLSCPYMDLALVVPTSTDSTRWTQMKTFLRTFLNDLDIGGPTANTQVAVVKYTGTAQTEFSLNTYQSKSAILTAIDAMQPLSGTGRSVAEAEKKLPDIFPFGTTTTRSGARTMAVIFFDAASDNKADALIQAQTLTNRGIYVLCVGVGQVDTDEMQKVSTASSDNSNNVFSVSSYDMLASQVSAFEAFLCTNRKPICPKQADVGIIIDESTSIANGPGGYTNFERIKNFTISIVQSFPVGTDFTRIGVILFSSRSDIVFPLNQYQTSGEIQAAISKLEIGGGETNISGALNDARRMLTTPSLGARANVKKILFLCTDGKANRAPEMTQLEANATKAAGVEIFTIGMTNNVDTNELRNISSPPPDSHFFFAANFNSLTDVLVKILGDTCLEIQTTTPTTITPPTSRTSTTTPTTTSTTTTTTTTTPTTTTTTPTTTTTTPTTTTTTPTTTTTTPTTTTTTPTTTTTTPTTTTTTPTTTTTTPTTTTTTPTTTTTTPTTTTTTPTTTTTYRIPDPLPTCNNSVDVVFIVDASGNIDYGNFRKTLDYIRDICLLLSIDSTNVRIGLMTYSDQPRVVFNLKDYTTIAAIRMAIANYSTSVGNSSNIAGALETLRTTMFTEPNGDRKDVPNVAVLFTSARSKNPTATQQQADLARRAGIAMVVVMLSNWMDMDEVNGIASYPTENTVYTLNLQNPQQASAQPLVNQICLNINVCKTSNPCLNNGACKNQVGRYECVCQPGYGGGDCNQVCRKPGDVIFAIDSSGSIGLDNWRLVTSFLMTAVQMLDLDNGLQSVDSNSGTRVGLLTYSNNSNIIFNLNSFMNKNALLQAFNTRYEGGGTNTASAIRTAVDQMFTPANGDRPNVTNYLIVMTDGMSDNTTATWLEAMRARNSGIVIIAIGVGNQYNYVELRSMASYPESTNVLTSPNFTALGVNLASQLGSLLCNNDDECLSNPCRNGQCVDGSGAYSCSACPPNTTGNLCERSCSGFIDLVIILDVSGSIQFERFPMVKEFVANLLRNLDIGPNSARVGLIYFSDTDHIAFYLNSYALKQDVIQAVRNIPFVAGKTNTASGLRELYTTMYLEKNGGRAAARRMAIVITDGEANIDAESTVKEAIKAHQSRIQIVTVAVGQPAFVNGDQIESIASIPTSANMFNISSYYSLPNISSMILMATCNDVNECASNPCQNGATCVDDYRRYYCLCSIPYSGYNCERRCSRQMDVVFVLDLSGSVQQSGNYRPMVDLVRRLIYGLDVRSGQVRVGVVTYTDQVDDQIFLKDYDRNVDNLIYAISFNHDGGKTNTQAALADVQNAQFTTANGDRPGASNIAILFSDGNSDVPEGSTPDANAAQNLRSSGATIYTVGIGDAPNSAELGTIAGNALESSFDIPNWSDATIADAVRSILDRLCQS